MWFPHITVATVVFQNNQFLMVHERPEGPLVINQPAGHLEDDETLIEAAIRETKEETGWEVEITHYLGVRQFNAANGKTYIRHSFAATPLNFDTSCHIDDDIIEATWMTYEEILAVETQLRSPLVLHDIKRFNKDKLMPLDFLYDVTDEVQKTKHKKNKSKNKFKNKSK